jgi:hypothetical protein
MHHSLVIFKKNIYFNAEIVNNFIYFVRILFLPHFYYDCYLFSSFCVILAAKQNLANNIVRGFNFLLELNSITGVLKYNNYQKLHIFIIEKCIMVLFYNDKRKLQFGKGNYKYSLWHNLL